MTKFMPIVFLLVCQLAWAEELPQPEPSQEAQAPVKYEDGAPREAWLASMQQNMPSKLCTQEMDFLNCYDTSEQECKMMVQWFTSACLNNIGPKLPEKVDINTGEQWGRMTGRCVFDLYQKFLTPKRIEKDGCPKIAAVNVEQAQPPQPVADPTKPPSHD